MARKVDGGMRSLMLTPPSAEIGLGESKILKIPRISGETLQVTIKAGDRLFIVGANGSGKSALIQYFVSSHHKYKIRRITAHRRTVIDTQHPSFPNQDRELFAKQYKQQEANDDARWKENVRFAQLKQSAVLFDLVAKENSQARSIAQHIRDKDIQGAAKTASRSNSPFEQINKLFRTGNLTVSLKLSEDSKILAYHEDENTNFSIAQMSDGERNAALIAADVLVAEPETILLIDEPERHLHRSVIEPLLSALFEMRKDCAFVISTHEIALPVTDPEANVLMLRSCRWNGDTTIAWDVEILEANTILPEDLKRSILGSRQKILFVEGTSNSLDLPLYSALFPDISVVPKGSCVDVQKAAKGLRESENLHHIKAFGLIDRDNRTEKEVKQLANRYIFALDMCSAEALYYCSDSIATVAKQQAESLGRNVDILIISAKEKALDALSEKRLAERMAARRCERQVHNLVQSKLPTWEEIKDSKTQKISVRLDSPYSEELKRFKELVNAGDLDGLIKRYPLRESGTFEAIAKALECYNRKIYEEMVLSRIRDKKEDLAEKLKKRIDPLSEMLKTTL